MNKIIYGAAYYDEYMPVDRLDKDIEMMKEAGINTVRIAESTWSTCEPQLGKFDFSHVIKVIDAMEKAEINIIIGTPTYAVPGWLVKLCPDVLATTKSGRGIYGPRQIMDITNETYLFYAERVIRELMQVTAHRKGVIGFQIDNETKYYGTAGNNVQFKFVKYLRHKFHDDLEAMNREFGLDYWSNRIDAWEDFPDVRGTINGSLGAEFEKFQRMLVDEFLTWQASIVAEYKRSDQFITHNFDFEWRGYSFGIQPMVNHLKAAQSITMAGVDIYHPAQDDLTGAEIAFGGDVMRSVKNNNYLVMETQAQGFPCWTPYKGQLRQCAYSHLASGADAVMYWHWHSIHNSFETYWKGLLSHDFEKNPAYDEACIVGNELKKIGSQLIHLKKNNKAAILVSNEALTALDWFTVDGTAEGSGKIRYNDIVRWLYDVLYKMNVECDIIWPETEDLSQYKVIFAPAIYAVPEMTISRLKKFAAQGGILAATFKSFFANENVKVFIDRQPHGMDDVFGISYNQFTFPKNVALQGELYKEEGIKRGEAKAFMELLKTTSGQVLANYDHEMWREYGAITLNEYGKGYGVYIGCMTDEKTLSAVIRKILSLGGLRCQPYNFPVIIREGINSHGKNIRYIFNYSNQEQKIYYEFSHGYNIICGSSVEKGQEILLPPWSVNIYTDK